MVRQTSAIAFKEVKDSGYVGRRQKEAYSALYIHGPATASELFYKVNLGRNVSHSNITTRLGELRDLGLVYKTQKRVCSRTGRLVIEWDVTDKLPTKPTKRVATSKAVLAEREACALIADHVAIESDDIFAKNTALSIAKKIRER